MSTAPLTSAQDAAQCFARHGYLSLPGELAPEICALATRYALLKEEVEFTPDDADGQVPGAHSVYGDALMESVLEMMRPGIERWTGLRLFATYSYYRVYRPGAQLKPHRDREACEISATACLGYRYLHEGPAFRWPLHIESFGGSPAVVTQEPGDLVVYRGHDLNHWRERFDASPGSYLVQLFLHYVDQDGPYKHHRYDGRQGLGRESESAVSAEHARALIAQAFPEFSREKG